MTDWDVVLPVAPAIIVELSSGVLHQDSRAPRDAIDRARETLAFELKADL